MRSLVDHNIAFSDLKVRLKAKAVRFSEWSAVCCTTEKGRNHEAKVRAKIYARGLPHA